MPRAAATTTRRRRRNGNPGRRGNGKLSELPLGSRAVNCAIGGAGDQAVRGGARKPACNPSRADFRTTPRPPPTRDSTRVIRTRNRRALAPRSVSTTAVRPTASTTAADKTRTTNKTGHNDALNVASEKAPASRDLSNDSCTIRKASPADAREATVPPRHVGRAPGQAEPDQPCRPTAPAQTGDHDREQRSQRRDRDKRHVPAEVPVPPVIRYERPIDGSVSDERTDHRRDKPAASGRRTSGRGRHLDTPGPLGVDNTPDLSPETDVRPRNGSKA